MNSLFSVQRTTLCITAMIGLAACANGESDADTTPDAGGIIDATVPMSGCANDPCFGGVLCTDTDSEPYFQCGSCPVGLEGDGVDCTEIDSCAEQPCFDGVECTDAPAPNTGFECGPCPSGFTGNGISCVQTDSCATGPCFPGVECTDFPPPEDGFSCGDCPSGLEGDGLTCTEIDGCAGSPCFTGVTCTDVPAPGTGFSCDACPSGYSGDGQTCELVCQPGSSIGCSTVLNSNNGAAGSTDNSDQYLCAPGLDESGPEIAFPFVAPSNGQVTVTLRNLSADLDLLVLEEMAGICNPNEASACVPGGLSNAAGTNDEVVNFEAQAGTTYYIIVDGFSGAVSDFTLSVGTSVLDININEISSGDTDFVEIVNRGSCDVSLAGLWLHHETSCDATPTEFEFPQGSVVSAGGVFRAVESNVTLMSNEVGIGAQLCDNTANEGSTAMCIGQCNVTDCSNIVDYVERSGSTAPDGIACASFLPAPVDVSGVTNPNTESLRRNAFVGTPGTWQSSDWVLGPTTRD